MPKLTLKEQICQRLSNALTDIAQEGKLARRTENNHGTFIHDDNRSQVVKILAEELMAEKEALDAISGQDLELCIFNALFATRNKPNIQDQAAAAAKLILAQRKTKGP